MSEIIIDKNAKQITFTNNGIGFSQFGIADEVLDLIENQIKEIKRLKRRLEEYQEYVEINHKEIERLKEREKMLQESFSDLKKGIEKERKYWLCERTDCCGRIKDSKKYSSLYQENKRLNNKLKDIKSQLDYLETYSSKEDVFEDMKGRLDRINKIIGSDKE